MGKLGIIRERVGKQDMRAVKYLLVVLLVVVGPPAFVDGQVDPADAWERRLNELQPPDKVLEAVGVRPGLVIGEVAAGTPCIWLGAPARKAGSMPTTSTPGASPTSGNDAGVTESGTS
jgi:hypothetical protein